MLVTNTFPLYSQNTSLSGLSKLVNVFIAFFFSSSLRLICLFGNDTVNKDKYENIVGKGENAVYQHFLLFPHCFLSFLTQIPEVIFYLSSANTLNLDWSKSFVVFFCNKPWSLRVCGTSHLKTLCKKEKLLVKSNFSFSHSVFHLFRELSAIFIKF